LLSCLSPLGFLYLPIYALVLITDEQKANDAGDVFAGYLAAELNNLK
jgi:hypothetical protein